MAAPRTWPHMYDAAAPWPPLQTQVLNDMRRHWHESTPLPSALRASADWRKDVPATGWMLDTTGVYDSGRRLNYYPCKEHHDLRGFKTITINHLVDGRLGVAIEGLQVTGILCPTAASRGFAVGDRICAVNGQGVADQDHFRRVLHYMSHELMNRGTPITVTVLPRPGSEWCSRPLPPKSECLGCDDGPDTSLPERDVYGRLLLPSDTGYDHQAGPVSFWDRHRVPESSPLNYYETRPWLHNGYPSNVPYGYTRREKGEWDC